MFSCSTKFVHKALELKDSKVLSMGGSITDRKALCTKAVLKEDSVLIK